MIWLLIACLFLLLSLGCALARRVHQYNARKHIRDADAHNKSRRHARDFAMFHWLFLALAVECVLRHMVFYQ